ncbi:MAG: hypothetical protein HKN26_04700 [Acidimicrobiales bacterium]|nr:hypothetical protein [Acidimicrobiales bacterium]
MTNECTCRGPKRWFCQHPHDTGESYAEHFRVAFGVSRRLAGASFAALVHAFAPNLHTTTASERIHTMHDCLEAGDREALIARKPPVVRSIDQVA